MSKAYFICPDAEIIDIGFNTHIEYIIDHPATFNLSLDEIISHYHQKNEQIPVEGVARKIIIMDLLAKGYIRIRQYRNHWSISLSKLDDDTKSRLSKWAEIAMTIPNSGKYGDCIIQTAIDGKKYHYSIQQLYSQTY